MPVYQHWDPLKTCMVGKSYPPEFYSWIENTKARNAMERIAIETEEDYQSLIKILKSFDVNVIRPDVYNDYNEYYIPELDKFSKPPMTPRDYVGTFGLKTFISLNVVGMHKTHIERFYDDVKDDTWPDINNLNDIFNLPSNILSELYDDFNLNNEISGFKDHECIRETIITIYNKLIAEKINVSRHNKIIVDNAAICRVGKDLYYPGNHNHTIGDIKQVLGNEYRINLYDGSGHADSCFCPVVPGLIISLKDFQNYKETFPEWEVIELPGQSWAKVKPFLQLKEKNHGKWWIPGEEGNDALTELIEDWLDNWVGYVEETVFDVNMLIINEQNVIVNNYNKKVFDALERYGVTPHICNFRHRYFWDGGIHCITADLDREGEMHDYFPERGEY